MVAAATWAAWPGSEARYAASAVVNRECFLSPVDNGTTGATTALGDSLTEGSTYPLLNAASPVSYFDVLGCDGAVPYLANEGRGGETSEQIAARVDDVLADQPDRVVVLAGTNDVLFEPDADTVANLDLIRRAVIEAGADPVVGLLPPIDAKVDLVRQVNASIERWAGEHGVTLIDFYAAVATEDGTWRDDLVSDGVHPNEAGAEAMASVAASVLSK